MSPTVTPSGEAWVQTASQWIAEAINRSIAERGCCHMALAGGNTPKLVYAALAERSDIDWQVVTLYFGDERAVPPDDPDSNYRAAQQSLIAHIAIPEAQVVRMQGEASDLDAAARAYEELLPDPLDLVLLGMGGDGHTASLFPGSASLDEQVRRVVPIRGPKPPFQRLTVTAPVITSARTVAMLVTGLGKAEAVVRALCGAYDPSITPACLARDGMWLLDAPAASKLL